MVEDTDMPHISDFADDLLDHMAEAVEESGEQTHAVFFAVWSKLTHLLTSAGWTKNELMEIIDFHTSGKTT
jgi:hypothetical protein